MMAAWSGRWGRWCGARGGRALRARTRKRWGGPQGAIEGDSNESRIPAGESSQIVANFADYRA
jgi:hypothetical protein